MQQKVRNNQEKDKLKENVLYTKYFLKLCLENDLPEYSKDLIYYQDSHKILFLESHIRHITKHIIVITNTNIKFLPFKPV